MGALIYSTNLLHNGNLEHTTFLRGKEQSSLEEEVETRSIASVHIHVARAIERVNDYRILQGVIPISYMHSWR